MARGVTAIGVDLIAIVALLTGLHNAIAALAQTVRAAHVTASGVPVVAELARVQDSVPAALGRPTPVGSRRGVFTFPRSVGAITVGSWVLPE